MNVLALCAGYGGLELGVRLAVGSAASVVCYVERDVAPAVVLARRMADECIAPAPIWSDLRTFDPSPWRGVVDCVAAGFPCQPFSAAGKRRGVDDARNLWPHVRRVVAEVEPTFVFFENSPGIRRMALDGILRDLADLGFDAEWSNFRACDVGAPHQRRRMWIFGVLANSDGDAWRDAAKRNLRVEAERRFADPLHDRPALDERPPWPPDRSVGPSRWPAGEPEPGVHGTVDGASRRLDRYHAIGNGVVPVAAAYAFRSLARRALGGLDR